MKRALFRLVSVVLAAALLPLNVPLALAAERPPSKPLASSPPETGSPKPPAAAAPTANRKLPKVKAPALRPVFSDPPTNLELFRARVFEEPLVAAGATTAADNRALGAALNRYLDRPSREEIDTLEEFLSAHPRSPWKTALLTNLGIVALRTGYVSKALEYHQQAWELGQDSADVRLRALSDRSLAERAILLSGLGRDVELESLLEEVEGRSFSGSSAARLDAARQNLWLMQNRPEEAFRCGPLAVGRLLWALEGRHDDKVAHAPSSPNGTSLAQMRDLARRAGLSLRMAKREDPEAPLPTLAVVHFKTGHFATVLERSGDRYLVADPIFDEERWISAKALDEESTGYVLGASLPSGFREVDESEAKTVWGRGCPNGPDPTNQTPCEPTSGGSGCGQAGQCAAMAGYTFLPMLAALRIVDTPVGYTPPRGPAFDFTLTYNQREALLSCTPNGRTWPVSLQDRWRRSERRRPWQGSGREGRAAGFVP